MVLIHETGVRFPVPLPCSGLTPDWPWPRFGGLVLGLSELMKDSSFL